MSNFSDGDRCFDPILDFLSAKFPHLRFTFNIYTYGGGTLFVYSEYRPGYMCFISCNTDILRINVPPRSEIDSNTVLDELNPCRLVTHGKRPAELKCEIDLREPDSLERLVSFIAAEAATLRGEIND